MARVHVWKYLRDKDGAAVPSADISVYLAGSNTPATIYLNEVGGEYILNTPQLKSNAAGFFEFWIGDDNELYGYNTAQKFKIAWERIGISSGYIDYIDAFPPVIAVDETSTDETRNKSVSNKLAKDWTDHSNDFSHLVHGIEEVDPTSSDEVKNKLVSDKILKDLSDDVAYLSTVTDDFNFRTDTAPTSAQAHGIQTVNTSSTDTVLNKLVSDGLAKSWTDHAGFEFNEDTVGLAGANAHGLELADSDSNDPTPNKLVSNALLNALKGTTNLNYDEDITDITWTLPVSAGADTPYEYTVNHSLNSSYPNVTIFDKDTETKVYPYEIINIDSNSIKIKVFSQFPAKIRCSI